MLLVRCSKMVHKKKTLKIIMKKTLIQMRLMKNRKVKMKRKVKGLQQKLIQILEIQRMREAVMTSKWNQITSSILGTEVKNLAMKNIKIFGQINGTKLWLINHSHKIASSNIMMKKIVTKMMNTDGEQQTNVLIYEPLKRLKISLKMKNTF